MWRADPYSKDVCNIPLPEQSAEETECLLNEPAENVPLPKQTEEDFKSLQNAQE